MSVYDPTSNSALTVDYTSRDYFALRTELINRVAERINASGDTQWNGDDPADFGVALIEAFAYMGDIINYYIDRVANESYLPTASQRQNIINLAAQFGYIPTGYRASTALVSFSNSGEEDVTLPVGTQVYGEVSVDGVVEQLIFSTTQEITVPASVDDVAGVAEVTCQHYEDVSLRPENLSSGPGDVAGEFLGNSNGEPNQRYVLSENQVVDDSVQVYVENGNIYEPWERVIHLSDYGPSATVYTIELDADNNVSVVFGDGVSGAIPVLYSGIKASYGVGGGELGNITTNVITELFRIPNKTSEEVAALADVISVTNSDPLFGIGRGGVDPESNESIKANAPRAITAINRAVSLEDYATLALLVGNVGKAKAEAENPKSVNLYVAPQRNTNDTFPGYDSTGTELRDEQLNLQNDVREFLSDKVMIGTSFTVAPPSYVQVTLGIVYTKLPQFDEIQLEGEIKNVILNKYSYQNLEFGQLISPEEIERDLLEIPGVRRAQVTTLERADGKTNGTTSIQSEPYEIFVFADAGLSLTASSSDASLSGINVPAGTALSPGFIPTFWVYNLLNVTTDQILLDPVPTDIGASVTINGKLPNIPVDTPAGETTSISIIVTAADGVTIQAYIVLVTR
jgi:hypothetical protein